MKVNNASLTGESEDINIDPDAAPIQNIFETKNVGFFGTSCTAGEGKGICFRTVDSTVICTDITFIIILLFLNFNIILCVLNFIICFI
jgi:magnesium-transporting ATPase (P-type)